MLLQHIYVSSRLQSAQSLINSLLPACLRDVDDSPEMKTAVVLMLLSVVALSVAVPLDNVSRVRREDKGKGGVDVDVHREKGVGTVVGVKGEGNVWSSKDGNTRVDAQGQWSRVYDGPARGKPNYSGGIHLSHKF